MKDQLLAQARALHYAGLLTRPEHIAVRSKDTLLTLHPSTDLENPQRNHVEVIKLSNIGPSDNLLNTYRQAMAARRSNRAVLLCTGPYTVALSQTGKHYRPILEDSAQILGVKLRTTRPGRIRAPLGTASALLILDQGGLCVAPNLYELEACALVLEKSCRSQVDSWFLGGGKPLSYFDRVKMRRMYKKYSKLIGHVAD